MKSLLADAGRWLSRQTLLRHALVNILRALAHRNCSDTGREPENLGTMDQGLVHTAR